MVSFPFYETADSLNFAYFSRRMFSFSTTYHFKIALKWEYLLNSTNLPFENVEKGPRSALCKKIFCSNRALVSFSYFTLLSSHMDSSLDWDSIVFKELSFCMGIINEQLVADKFPMQLLESPMEVLGDIKTKLQVDKYRFLFYSLLPI